MWRGYRKSKIGWLAPHFSIKGDRPLSVSAVVPHPCPWRHWSLSCSCTHEATASYQPGRCPATLDSFTNTMCDATSTTYTMALDPWKSRLTKSLHQGLTDCLVKTDTKSLCSKDLGSNYSDHIEFLMSRKIKWIKSGEKKILVCVHIHIHTCIHAYAHTYMCTHTHEHTHTWTHMHTCTHTLWPGMVVQSL